MRNQWIAASLAALLLPGTLLAQGKGKVVEEIIARVNNDIITLSDYEKAQAAMHQEIAQDCPTCTPAQVDQTFQERRKNLLRDLIDQSLLVQRAKDMAISVETELVKRLDAIRQQNNLPSMEALEKAVESSGIGWEEYKTQLRNGLLTQEVIHREVGSRIDIGNDEVKKYYNEHQSEFNRPELVYLSEILVSTDGKSPEEIPALEKKANDLLARFKKGEGDFAELAKRYSDGSTAKQGGELGGFEPGQLSKELEVVVFKMNRGDVTDVIRTKSGFEILRVNEHYKAGLQPLDKVQNEIVDKLYSERMQPALRSYLAELREESYMLIKAGYADSAAVAGNTAIEESQPTPDVGKQKRPKKSKKG
jgi:peptidyl-prolyl cis-trans isomerase SurA